MNIELTKVEYVALEMLIKSGAPVWCDYLQHAEIAVGAMNKLMEPPATPEPVEDEPQDVSDEALSWQERHGLYADD